MPREASRKGISPGSFLFFNQVLNKATKAFNLNEINDELGFNLAKNNFGFGFSALYLKQCLNDQVSKNAADINTLKKLVNIDREFGVTVLEQLNWCLDFSTRSNIIQVSERVFLDIY